MIIWVNQNSSTKFCLVTPNHIWERYFVYFCYIFISNPAYRLSACLYIWKMIYFILLFISTRETYKFTITLSLRPKPKPHHKNLCYHKLPNVCLWVAIIKGVLSFSLLGLQLLIIHLYKTKVCIVFNSYKIFY